MVRQSLKAKEPTSEDAFRLRGLDNTRIEALSDGVFALAIAMLIISTSIPSTFDELLLFLADLVPFAVCVTLLMVIWYQHYIFFARYGLKDAKTVAINTILLLLVLFYIYPLKFLFQILVKLFFYAFSGRGEEINQMFKQVIPFEKTSHLMVIYGIGAGMIFLVMAWLYINAYRKRSTLDLSEIETFDTKNSIYTNLIMAGIPLLSALIAGLKFGGDSSFMISGFTYFLYPVIFAVYGIRADKQRKKLTQVGLHRASPG
ncbi:MAG: TMEM175 family protein [Cyclobacteriaceae bacterium]